MASLPQNNFSLFLLWLARTDEKEIGKTMINDALMKLQYYELPPRRFPSFQQMKIKKIIQTCLVILMVSTGRFGNML